MMLNRSTIISAILLPCALISTWLIFQWLAIPKMLPAKADQPDSYMIDIVASRMTRDGKLKDQLTSPLMVHYSINDTVDITTPHLMVFPETGNPWHLDANKGQARDQIKIIELWGNVRIEQPAGPDNPHIIMTTQALTIFPKEELAQTKSPVTVEHPDGIAHSIGMHVNLKTGEVDLLSQTHGKYEEKKIK